MSDNNGLSAPVASAPSRRVVRDRSCRSAERKRRRRAGRSWSASSTWPAGSGLASPSSPRLRTIPSAVVTDMPSCFRRWGQKADWLRVERREEANQDETLELLRAATGIFITGGDQARLVELLVGTLVMECIRLRNADGSSWPAPAPGPPFCPP